MSNILDGLNPRQREAAVHFEGPLLILAGAGSGKTRVLTHRIAWLIQEKKINPWNILAITFTNKAAQEMRERVNKLVEFGADSVWVATFHSTCGRILRRFAEGIGYGTNFTIYDTDDQKSVMKEVCKRLQINVRIYKEKLFLNAISSAKDELIDPAEYARQAQNDPDMRQISRVYDAYQETLHKNNAMDFDDMIALTVRLFRECPDVLEYYRRRFSFIMVDEYQDTNTAQFELIRLLAGENGNLCVVGDDDQSIYGFRGANIRNILNFEDVYPGAKVVRLEQNYRSTPDILDTANAVISNNRGRKKKTLWTQNEAGPRTAYYVFPSAFEEADFVAQDIAAQAGKGNCRYGDCAVLYRTNAQSRLLEEKLLLTGIPYRIVGGVQFYARKEIKDLISFLKAIDNPQDEVALHRIINIPKRGIGAASIGKAEGYAAVNGISFYEALKKSREIPGMGRAAAKMEGFVTFLATLRSKAEYLDIRQLLDEIIEQTGYVKELEEDGTAESKDRIANIDELFTKIAAFMESEPDASLNQFLQEVSLVSDMDTVENNGGRVLLMTLHSAKGLEFPRVYLTGMEESIFPSYQSIMSDRWDDAVEEERRLCYVGITRAMKELVLTSARCRMIHGERRYNAASRFIEEIPKELLDCRFGTDSSGLFRRNSPENGVNRETPDTTGMKEPIRSGTSADAARTLRQNPFQSKGKEIRKADHLEYSAGDRVTHVKFGTGTVVRIDDGGRDYEVTVDFDTAGIRKMFAAFAKLKKI